MYILPFDYWQTSRQTLPFTYVKNMLIICSTYVFHHMIEIWIRHMLNMFFEHELPWGQILFLYSTPMINQYEWLPVQRRSWWRRSNWPLSSLYCWFFFGFWSLQLLNISWLKIRISFQVIHYTDREMRYIFFVLMWLFC